MNMRIISDIVGVSGVILVTLMYFLLQIRRVNPDKLLFSVVNALGSVLIIFSLWFNWNLSSVIMEGFWLSISVYGSIKSVRSAQESPLPKEHHV